MSDLSPSIELLEGKPVVSSLKIAEHFGKRHDDVLKKIRLLIKSLSDPAWGIRNFAETPDTDPQNGQTYTAYNLSRDAFSLLAMGFTGKKALEWKLLYIKAFNTIEAELAKALDAKHQAKKVQAPAPDFCCRVRRGFVPISEEQLRALMGLLTFWADLEQISVEAAWQHVLDKMGIPSWEYIQGQEFDQLIWDIHRMLYRASRAMQSMPTSDHDMKVINGLLDYGAIAKGYTRHSIVELVCAMCGVPNLDNLSPLGASKVKMALWCGLAELNMVSKANGK